MTRLTTVADPEAAAARVAEELARLLEEAVERRGVAHVALAGGNTPRRAYELLAGGLRDWSAVELWYGDERCVAAEDPQSNHRLVAEALLANVRGAAPREHRIHGERGAEAAARAYEEELRAHVAPRVNGAPREGERVPTLDVALLGLGEDGHTASLFPGHPQVRDASGALCLAVRDAPKPPPERVTLSLGVLRATRHCVLLATGAGKADALAAVLAGPDRGVPASLLASGRLLIVVDDAAAPPAGDSGEAPGESSGA